MKLYTQRQAALALGISRTKLVRMLADGLPFVRVGDKMRLNLKLAKRWIATHENAGRKKLAPVLHPDDPRHRERTASAALAEIKFGLASGIMVRNEDVTARLHREFIAVRAATLTLPSHIGAASSTDEIEASIGAAIEEALSALTIDDPSSWPTPRPAPTTAEPEAEPAPITFETNEEEAKRDTLPLLAPGDPRHAFASARANQKQMELRTLEESVVPIDFAIRTAHQHCKQIRASLRALPFDIACAIGDGPIDREAVHAIVARHAHGALNFLSAESESIAA